MRKRNISTVIGNVIFKPKCLIKQNYQIYPDSSVLFTCGKSKYKLCAFCKNISLNAAIHEVTLENFSSVIVKTMEPIKPNFDKLSFFYPKNILSFTTSAYLEIEVCCCLSCKNQANELLVDICLFLGRYHINYRLVLNLPMCYILL